MDAIARGLATRALAEIALIDTGQPVELRTTSTHLQWRRVGDTNWTNLVPLVETGSALDFDWDGTSLGVKRQTEATYTYVDLIGPQGPKGDKGDTGANLEFTWNGTELGVRVEGAPNYQFVDLQADPIGIGDGLEADGSGTVSVDNTVVRTTRSVTAGTGLSGGGDLSADRELAVDDTIQRSGVDGSRLVPMFTMSQTDNDTVNLWREVGEIRLNTRYNDSVSTLLVEPYSYGTGDSSSAIVTIRVKQQEEFGNNPAVSVTALGLGPISIHRVGLQIVSNAGPTIVKIFFQVGRAYTSTYVYALSQAGTQITWDVKDFLTTAPPLDVESSASDNRLIHGGSVEQVTPVMTQRLQARSTSSNTTLALGDVDSVVEVNSASARTVTVPTNASVALPVGAVIEIVRWGAGAVTITPASGVTLRSPDDARDIATQYGSAFLRKRDTNEWHLTGDLE